MSHNHEAEESHAPHHYSLFVLVWLSLLILTGLTVAVAYIDMGSMTIPVALFIATIKSILVVSYFMHLKFEPSLFKYMFGMALATILVILMLTFADVLTRVYAL